MGHPDVLTALERGEVEALFAHADGCAPCRVALLEHEAYPAGCSQPARGHEVLTLLDRIAAEEEKDPELLAHLEACPSCAAEAAAARAEHEAARALGARVAAELEAAPELKIGLSCVYCHDRLEKPETVYCAACLAPHHGECFTEHGACAVLGCEETEVIRRQGEERPRAVLLKAVAAAAAVSLLGVAAVAVVEWSGPATVVVAPTSTSTSAPPAPAEKDPLLARVGGVELRRSDLDLACAIAGVERFDARMAELTRLIEEQALINEADRLGIELSDREQNQLDERARSEILTRRQNNAWMRLYRRYPTGAELALHLRRAARVERLLVREVRVDPITDAQVQAYYQLHAHRFRSGGETRVREILLLPDASDAVRVPEAIRQRVGGGHTWDPRSFRPRTPIDPARFAEAQRAYSMGSIEERVYPAADVAPFLVPELAAAINDLKPDQLARVETYLGTTHIVKLIDRRPPGQQTLEQAAKQIRRTLLREALAERRRAYRARIVARAGIQTFLSTPR